MDTRQTNILVAVDGSPPSEWALRVAATLAKRLDANVSIVHVIPPPTTDITEGALVLIEDLSDALKASGTALLDKAAARMPKEIPVSRVLRQGYPSAEIVAQARESGAGYIVMGSRGRGRWFHFILGSTAEAVVRDAPCPVITVAHDPDIKLPNHVNHRTTRGVETTLPPIAPVTANP
jgi:nucleotide-binding universal stress UspA family protein